MMTESKFLQHSDQLFTYIEDQLDKLAIDIDCLHSGNVLTLETDDGTQIIINRHTPNQELWIAAKSGGYHFAHHQGTWLATRDKREFFTVLNEVLSAATQENIAIPAMPTAQS